MLYGLKSAKNLRLFCHPFSKNKNYLHVDSVAFQPSRQAPALNRDYAILSIEQPKRP
jgi:hypothetical protein